MLRALLRPTENYSFYFISNYNIEHFFFTIVLSGDSHETLILIWNALFTGRELLASYIILVKGILRPNSFFLVFYNLICVFIVSRFPETAQAVVDGREEIASCAQARVRARRAHPPAQGGATHPDPLQTPQLGNTFQFHQSLNHLSVTYFKLRELDPADSQNQAAFCNHVFGNICFERVALEAVVCKFFFTH